ncbi:arylsulfatase [Verrucomicrobia bacterium]|nr:arylsulfatase [Verrucomicrobiota bacterium]
MNNLHALIPLLLFSSSLTITAKQPNVIILMTDDQGYGELSVHGNPVLKTPNLDRLHSESVRFEDFHVAPMCTPTRGQLLTGLDSARNGAINVSSGRTLLRSNLPTMASLLKKGGYLTGLFGKWHLGDTYPYRPDDRGFDETLWFPSSHINSTPDVWDNDYFDDTYRHNGTLEKAEGYCTDVFFTKAIEWMEIQKDADKPFFCYLPTNAPHGPHWVPQKYRDAMTVEFQNARDAGTVPVLNETKKTAIISYLAMIKNIDDNYGRLDEFLTKSGLAEDTIVVYLTDNGSTFGEIYYDAGMRGRKTQLWEGGHRVPCFVRWPNGEFGKPRGVQGLTQVQDLLPTLLDLCNVKTDGGFDGISLAPVLRGKAPVEDRMLIINYSRMPGYLDYPAPDSPSIMRRKGAGVLWKHWRLLEETQLYNLKMDPMQKENLINDQPEVTAKMRRHLVEWWADVKETANEPQPVVIGHPKENPVMLTACEWLDVFIDQQGQIRRGDQKNGWWEIEVASSGDYEFELRRWPREVDVPMDAGMPVTWVTDGELKEGVELAIKSARIRLGDRPGQTKRVKPGDKSVTFKTGLSKGRNRLYTWFLDERRQPLLGAYYVYVKKL